MNRLSGLLVDLIIARMVLPVVMFVLARILPKALLPVAGPLVAIALPVVAGYAVKFVKQRKGEAV